MTESADAAPMRFVVLTLCSLGLMVSVGCGHDKSRVVVEGAAGRGAATPEKAAPLEGAPIVALTSVDAPGYNVSDLTARLRDAMVHTSGVVIVDDLSVRAEVAACVEMPCKDTQQEAFKNASLVASATLSRVGATLIGSVRVQAGLKELVRVNGSGADAGAVVQQLGFEAGSQLRKALSAESPDAPVAPSEER